VVADERDVIRVRTNYRKSPPEDVYLFRVTGPPENGRRVFLDYIRGMNELREQPRFYNTLTTNCTTMILAHAAINPGHIPYSWKVLLSGYAPEYAYERGRLDQTLPFEELKRRARQRYGAGSGPGARLLEANQGGPSLSSDEERPLLGAASGAAGPQVRPDRAPLVSLAAR
jgi:hypothetical protein